eukprot:5447045-Pleurochrysis_carterae.AAC.1
MTAELDKLRRAAKESETTHTWQGQQISRLGKRVSELEAQIAQLQGSLARQGSEWKKAAEGLASKVEKLKAKCDGTANDLIASEVKADELREELSAL